MDLSEAEGAAAMTMPNFLIIGAPKAGTSAIYAYLKQHPEVYMSPVKEPHFFMLENEKVSFKGPGDQERFRSAVYRIEEYQNLFSNVANEIAVGEASTTYLGSQKACNNIKKHIPHAKLVAVLRNPVEAAYASFLHLVRDGNEPTANFSKALKAEPKRIQNNWGLIWRYQQRGLYAQQIENYFGQFDQQQIKIYIYDDFKENPKFIMKDIFTFIGVDPNFEVDMSSKYNVSGMPKSLTLNRILAKENLLKRSIKLLLPSKTRSQLYDRIRLWNLDNFKKPKMSAAAKKQLIDGYRSDILLLQDLIQRDLSSWLKL